MRILEFTGEPIGTGGQEMFIVNVIRHLHMSDCTIDWATPYFCNNEAYKYEITSRGGSVVAFGLSFNPGGSRFNVIKPLYSFLKSTSYDVIHIHSGSISVLACGALVAKIVGIKKIIVHSHNTGIKKDWKYFLLKAIYNPLLRWLPSDYCACSMLAGEWKFPQYIVKNKLRVLNNGIDLEKFKPDLKKREEIRSQLNLDKDTILLGHVGRLSFMKNQEFLILIQKTLKERKIKSQLLLIGEGESYEMLQELVEKYQLMSDVIFLGTTQAVYDYMQAMDVFLFPSRWEGFGMVAVEAQAVGVPVVASEYVPQSVKLTEGIVYLPLEKEGWVNAIKQFNGYRYDNTRIIDEKGYNVNNTANLVESIYRN